MQIKIVNAPTLPPSNYWLVPKSNGPGEDVDGLHWLIAGITLLSTYNFRFSSVEIFSCKGSYFTPTIKSRQNIKHNDRILEVFFLIKKIPLVQISLRIIRADFVWVWKIMAHSMALRKSVQPMLIQSECWDTAPSRLWVFHSHTKSVL
jgi:hypothetical protein